MVARYGIPVGSIILLLFAFAFAINWTNSWDNDALLAGLVACAIPVVPLIAYLVLRALDGDRVLGPALAVVLIVAVTIVLRVRAYDDKSIDLQVIIKLGAIAGMAAAASLFFLRNGGRPVSTRTVPWLLLLTYLCVTAAYSPTPLLSFVYALSLAIGLLFTGYLVESYGAETTVGILLVAGFMIIVPSIAVYLVAPSLVSMHGWTGDNFGNIDRLRGFTQSGNAIGGIAALCLLLLLLFPAGLRRLTGRILFFPVMGVLTGLTVLCLILSNHRAGLGAAATAALMYYTLRRAATIKLMALALAASIGAAVFAFYSDEILSLLSRSGNASEIATVTGRSQIWSVVLEYWQSRPIFGYGYSASLHFLPNDPRLFGVAAHAHDVYLELLLSGGVIALALFLLALGFTLFPLRKGMLRPSCLLVYFLMRGITEASPMNNLLEFSTFGFWFSIWLLLPAPQIRSRAAPAEVASFSESEAALTGRGWQPP
jgi:O-antigen ligase